MIALNLYENLYSEYKFTSVKDEAPLPATHEDRIISANLNNQSVFKYLQLTN